MPWLAPMGTPADSGPIESQVPIWQSILASRSRGFAFTRGSACARLERLGVGIGMGLARAQAFDAMIDRADPGRKPQPFRRVHGYGGSGEWWPGGGPVAV